MKTRFWRARTDADVQNELRAQIQLRIEQETEALLIADALRKSTSIRLRERAARMADRQRESTLDNGERRIRQVRAEVHGLIAERRTLPGCPHDMQLGLPERHWTAIHNADYALVAKSEPEQSGNCCVTNGNVDLLCVRMNARKTRGECNAD